MKMNIPLMATLLGLSLIVCPLMYIYVGPALDATQLSTLKTLGTICACSAIWCFVVGELTGNNSQMDKLWSLLPIAYTWIIAINGGMQLRGKEPISSNSGRAKKTTAGAWCETAPPSRATAWHGACLICCLFPSTRMRWS